jgi:sortase A
MPTLKNTSNKRLRLAAIALAMCGFVPLAHAGYMHAKASLAQVLLQRAWERTATTGVTVKPWSWADTAPVARLRVERLGIEQIVLSGDSGRALAFGPGWTESSARPGMSGLSVISAHRDTHFTFLRDLVIDDRIELQTTHGIRRYRVRSIRIADANRERIDTQADGDGLLLVTCYPFDALTAGGSLRYVVSAIALDSDKTAATQAPGLSSESESMAGGPGGVSFAPGDRG